VAAGKLKAPVTWEPVIASLGERGLAPLASRALVAAGEGALPALADAWDLGLTPPVQVALARIVQGIGGPQAAALLRSHVAEGDERVRDATLEALDRVGYRAGEAELPELLERIGAEAADAAWANASLDDLELLQDGEALRAALELQFRQARSRVLCLLSFLYEPTALRRARDHLADTARDRRAYALEVLDVTLPRELKDMVLPLCEELRPGERRQRLAAVLPEPRLDHAERLRDVLACPLERVTPWTLAAAAYVVGRLGADGVSLAASLDRIAGLEQEPMVRETADWARGRLARRATQEAAGRFGEGGRPMLTVEKVVTLKSVPMFARASEEELADIAAILEEVAVREGETVFRKGDLGDSLYVIVEGRVRVFDEERTITELGERDVFGELALLDPEPRIATIAALEDTQLLRLDREAFAELMAGNIDIVRGVLGVLCERLRRVTY
jgi:hypothetical protein